MFPPADPLTELHCVSCGVRFGIPEKMRLFRSRDRKHFHCPNGHHNVWPHGRSYEEIRDENTSLKGRVAQLSHLLDQAEARLGDDRPVVIQQAPLPAPKEDLPRPVRTCVCVECGERKKKKGCRHARKVLGTVDGGLICPDCITKVRP